MTTVNSTTGIDTSYIVPDNCIATMAVNKSINSTNAIICPTTIPPTATEGVIFVFFPRTCGNCSALNNECDVWLGFSTSTSIISGIKHTSTASTTTNNLTGFSCGTSCNPCNPCGNCSSSSCSLSGVSCQSNQAGISVNIEFAVGVASVVSKNACPCQTVIFLNLDNRLGYHAMFDSSDNDPGLDFIFPECTGGSANVVYGPAAKAAIDAYRKFHKHPVSTETMTPTVRANFVLNEVAKYAAQNVASCSNRCSEQNRHSEGKSCGKSSRCSESSECSECERRPRPKRRPSTPKRCKSPERKPTNCNCLSCRTIL